MASRIVLNDLTNLQSESTAVGTINANNEILEDFSEEALTKAGPNVLTSDVDMNGNDIINLPAPVHGTSPVRKQEFDEAIGNLPELLSLATEVEEARDEAVAAAASAQSTAAGITASVAAQVDAAEDWAEIAEAWANNDVGVEVPGSGGGLSAKHWATIAQEIALGDVTESASIITFTPAGTIAATNVQGAIEELDTETQAALALKADSTDLTDQSIDANFQTIRWEYGYTVGDAVSLNTITTPGFYVFDGTQTNRPSAQSGTGFLVVQRSVNGLVVRQTVYASATADVWTRTFVGSVWSNWSKAIFDTDMASAAQVRAKSASPALAATLWSAVAQGSPVSASGTLTLNLDAGINFFHQLTGNVTVATPSNLYPGQSGVLVFQQDGTGGRTVSWSSTWRFPTGTSSNVASGANAYTAVFYHVITASLILCSLVRY
jgi:nucleotide-binding universal stress UspA family protein